MEAKCYLSLNCAVHNDVNQYSTNECRAEILDIVLGWDYVELWRLHHVKHFYTHQRLSRGEKKEKINKQQKCINYVQFRHQVASEAKLYVILVRIVAVSQLLVCP